MKNKAKQTLSFILMLTLISTVFAGCGGMNNTQTSNKPVQTDLSKWVLTNEETLFNFSNNNWIERSDYGYDQYGRLNYYRQLHTYDSSVQEYTYSDFSYDDNGNVLSYTEMKNYDNETEKRLCQFEYDKNGKPIKSTTTHSNAYEEIVEFEYDKSGNITKKSSKELFDGEFDGENIDYEYTLTYENDLCIMAEIVAIINEYDDGVIQYTDTEYVVEKYSYDSNGNKVKSENYWGNSDNDYGDAMINGIYYELETTTTYTWQKLGDVINDASNITDNQSSSTILNQTATETPKRLSDDCDKILASGYNSNNDYYELVTIESESYNTQSKIGVIKNNRWLIEPTTDAPFFDEHGAILNDYPSENYIFCCESCFAYGYSGRYGVVWNVEKNILFDGPKYSDGRASNVIKFKTQKISSDGAVVDFDINNYTKVFYHYSGTNFLDIKSMESKHLESDAFYHPAHFSDGLFYSENYDQTQRGFYDENFNLAIDLSAYNITTDYYNMYFDDGVCNFWARNSSGIEFLISIDKGGNVISEVRSES